MDQVKKQFKYFPLLALTLGIGISPVGYAQDFYKWVDANGSTHYTKTPPPKGAKKLGAVNTINDTPSGSSYRPAPVNTTQNNQAQPNTQPNQSTTQTNTQTEQVNQTPVSQAAANQAPSVPAGTSQSTTSAPTKGERILLPAPQQDPTANQPSPILDQRSLR